MTEKAPDMAGASVPDTLAALHVDPEKGLSGAEVDSRRKGHGCNEVAVQNGHPVRYFLHMNFGSNTAIGMGTWRAALATALASFLFAGGPGHNIPVLGGTPAAGKGLALLVTVVLVSAIVLVESQAWLTRQPWLMRRKESL